MILSKLLQYLTNGELSQLSLGNVATNENLIPKIISGINLGTEELYKRFPIKLSRIEVHLQGAIQEYYLHSSKALSNMPIAGNILDYYLHDNEEPFTDNIIRIETVYDELSEELPLNVVGNSDSLVTINHNVLRVSNPVDDIFYTIEYRASAPIIGLEEDPDTIEVNIPNAFTEALINYVAYRVFAAINMNSAEAVNYYAKFETSCVLLNNLGLWNKEVTTNFKLENSGWV